MEIRYLLTNMMGIYVEFNFLYFYFVILPTLILNLPVISYPIVDHNQIFIELKVDIPYSI